MSRLPSPARADPFALDSLDDFKPAPTPKPKPEPASIREVSEANNFPSRAAVARTKNEPPKLEPKPQRRHRTGRNVQFNIKATAATIERFTKLAEAQGWVFGEVLDRALDALETSLTRKSR